jgi:hypothetical protein
MPWNAAHQMPESRRRKRFSKEFTGKKNFWRKEKISRTFIVDCFEIKCSPHHNCSIILL